MQEKFFVAIDFDGTVTGTDVLDSVLEACADPLWKKVEALWESGSIGSKECLEMQMSLVSTPFDRLFEFIDIFRIDENFISFTEFLHRSSIPYAIISDGFDIFIQRLLKNAGLNNIPVYSNSLKKEKGKFITRFPFSYQGCPSATCKCRVADTLSNGLPVILIGDGQSDFCLAKKSLFAFTKNKLTDYCKNNDIPHHPFSHFGEVEDLIKISGALPRMLAERNQHGKCYMSDAI
jgi:2-hydroxy-3-keto-5-methylthiopentenyl-1-phosphate phosphatase